MAAHSSLVHIVQDAAHALHQVAVLVKDGSGSTSNAEAQAARLVEMLDRALLALDEVRPGSARLHLCCCC